MSKLNLVVFNSKMAINPQHVTRVLYSTKLDAVQICLVDGSHYDVPRPDDEHVDDCVMNRMPSSSRRWTTSTPSDDFRFETRAEEAERLGRDNEED